MTAAVGPPASRSMTNVEPPLVRHEECHAVNAHDARLDRPHGASLFSDSSSSTPDHLDHTCGEGRLRGPTQPGLFRHRDVLGSNHSAPQAISRRLLRARFGAAEPQRTADQQRYEHLHQRLLTVLIPLLAPPADGSSSSRPAWRSGGSPAHAYWLTIISVIGESRCAPRMFGYDALANRQSLTTAGYKRRAVSGSCIVSTGETSRGRDSWSIARCPWAAYSVL